MTLLLAPLRALCAIQLEHGAQQHHSKQELLAKGIWSGDRPKKNRNKLNRERLLIERYQQLQIEHHEAEEDENRVAEVGNCDRKRFKTAMLKNSRARCIIHSGTLSRKMLTPSIGVESISL